MQLTIRELCLTLKEEGMTNYESSVLLGISALQVELYLKGETKTAGIKVALAAMNHITWQGEPVYVQPYRGRQDVLKYVGVYAEQTAKHIGDQGNGEYNIAITPIRLGEAGLQDLKRDGISVQHLTRENREDTVINRISQTNQPTKLPSTH